MKSFRMPVLFISHGGGPWPWMAGEFQRGFAPLRAHLESVLPSLSQKPRAIVMVTAHWEESTYAVASSPAPKMIYDYGGFPPHTYQIQYPAPGDPELASLIQKRIEDLTPSRCLLDSERGFDHGIFVPMAVMHPEAEIPVVSVAIVREPGGGFSVEKHLALGRALSELRNDGVFIVGSGLSTHNLRAMFAGKTRYPTLTAESVAFDRWLNHSVTELSGQAREQALGQWEKAPFARANHPREDHLVPLFVCAGAAGDERGRQVFSDMTEMGPEYAPFAVSGFEFS